MDYRPIDRLADALLAEGLGIAQAWQRLCAAFPGVHSNVLAERVTAAAIDAGR